MDATAAIIAAESGGNADEWRVRFADVLADPRRRFLVAEVNGSVVGFGQARLIVRDRVDEGEPAGGWYLSGVTVAPQYRRLGVGLALTEARLEQLSGEVVYYAAEPTRFGSDDEQVGPGRHSGACPISPTPCCR